MDLSILVTAYNHEKYIAYALDSILMQKTQYEFEVLISEDCSTDNTANILREYESKYPGFFKIFYREKNYYQQGISNTLDLAKNSSGEYIIVLEGDDFWTDEKKLEKQIYFLKNHPDYIAVAHNCHVVDYQNNITNDNYPQCREKEYSINHWMYHVFPGQTATLMHRNIFSSNMYNIDLLNKGLVPGDYLKALVLLNYGKIYCIQEDMSAYRHVVGEGSSFSANYKYDAQTIINYCYEIVKYSRKMGKFEKQSEMRFLQAIIRAFRKRKINLQCFISHLMRLHHFPSAIYLYILYLSNKTKYST